MISKVEHCKPKNDNYARLARYIADASHGGEKSLFAWCAGCADDDYLFNIQEAKDVQKMNTRTTKSKTYHLIISFRPEDENNLQPHLYQAIEKLFAKALGFSEHQRHCGVHKNTGNLHMHVAYNMIHPEKFTRHEPYRDYIVRNTLCRELEQEFGLSIDNGRGQKHTNLGAGAAKLEAHTGHQSFESYVTAHKAPIMEKLSTVPTWQEVHKIFALYGIEIVPHGNGLVIRDKHSKGIFNFQKVTRAKHAMKASTFDRNLSKNNMEKRFGRYEKAQNIWPEKIHYSPTTPIHRSPERGELFAEYQRGIAQRKEALKKIHDFQLSEQQFIRKKWAEKRQEILQAGLKRGAKYRLFKLLKLREKEEQLQMQKTILSQKNTLSQTIPYTSWTKFLQHKTLQENDLALAILRSRNEETQPEQSIPTEHWLETLQKQEHTLQQRKDILTANIPLKNRKQLLSMLYIREINAKAQVSIDKRGTLIFTLQDGAIIRDTGKSVFFSKEATEKAQEYARRKWGRLPTSLSRG